MKYVKLRKRYSRWGILFLLPGLLGFSKQEVISLFSKMKIEEFRKKDKPDRALFHGSTLPPVFEVVAKNNGSELSQ